MNNNVKDIIIEPICNYYQNFDTPEVFENITKKNILQINMFIDLYRFLDIVSLKFILSKN